MRRDRVDTGCMEQHNATERRTSIPPGMSMDWMGDLTDDAALAAFVPASGELAVGTRVDWINDYGVIWSGRTISEVERDANGKVTGYGVMPTNTPWVMKKPRQVRESASVFPEVNGAL